MSEDIQIVNNGTGKTYAYPRSRYSDPTRKDHRRKSTSSGWKVAEMYDNHHEIARRLVLGQAPKDIAAALGCTPQTISNVKNSPVVQDKISIMHAARDAGTIELATEIANLAPIAVQRVKEALSTGKLFGQEVSAANILKEANNILDREMGKAVQRVDTRSTAVHITAEDLARIKERAMELAPLADTE